MTKPVIDRQKVCPLLLRLFINKSRHNSLTEYKNGTTPPVSSELQIYTWIDATLSELTDLVREVREDCSQKGTIFSYCIVYADPQSPNYKIRQIGITCGGKKGPDDDLTLSQSKFQIGDHIDLAISHSGNIPQVTNEQSSARHRNQRGRN